MKKHQIVYGKAETGIQRKAVALLTEYLLDAAKEYPACYAYGSECAGENVRSFYIGTAKTNPRLAKIAPEPLTHAEEYRVTVRDDTVYIEGADDRGVLYGIVDFFGKYTVRLDHPADDRYHINCLEDVLPDAVLQSHPTVKCRGLWTWGHVIYDYRGYLDNMVKMKLNTVTVWNDAVPLNASEFVSYAHDCGIRVIWGYSWLWSTDCKSVRFDRLEEQSGELFAQYLREYAGLGGDGIYFQSATELHGERVGGVVVAEAVTRFVNKTAALFFEHEPKLELQFGLHATSVRTRLDIVASTDPRIRIVWEDCGAFPFSYFPTEVSSFDETMALVREIACLRGENDRFGVVTKGLTKLDWSSFEHPDAPRWIGVSSGDMKADRILRKRKIWRSLQAAWLANAAYARDAVRLMRDLKMGDLYISALAEDGMIEAELMYPAALFAEMLWDADRGLGEIMREVALRTDTVFA